MLYAKVVVGLPVEGPFDYCAPPSLYKKIKAGMRVRVEFRTKKILGYVVRLTRKTTIKNIKPILELIDDSPLLDKNMLSLTEEMSKYYGCSWGEAIDSALPKPLRNGRELPKPDAPSLVSQSDAGFRGSNNEILLIHDLDKISRWEVYIQEIKDTLSNHKSAIILLPDKDSIAETMDLIKERVNCSCGVLYRQQDEELMQWSNIKNGKFNCIIGARSSIFAPVSNLGLVIIDEEQDTVYKQDQEPHYHAREIAFIRINIEKARLILGSTLPSLESFYLAKKGRLKYSLLPKKRELPEIKIINTQALLTWFKDRKRILSGYLEDCINQALVAKGKILLVLNRSGFATFASCQNCGVILKCPRCNINLVYHFTESILSCHYCNFKMQPTYICTSCHSGYIRYVGCGTQKLESELSRIFPQARIKRIGSLKDIDIENTDIFISTKSIIKEKEYNFDLIGVLSIDNSLNHIDFRSTEKTFALLAGLLGLTTKKIIIQTNLPNHYCFQAIEKKDFNMFYREELNIRKQLMFPPYQHLCLVKVRGRKEERAKEISNVLFTRLNNYKKNKRSLKIISLSPGEPAKLRGNFYWQILIKSGNAKKITQFLKMHLKNFSHSGIIVTVDMDPL